ncbi:MAG: hypothetical protein JSS30_05250 [Verrucomicrobia bacterium]|nr:hypothetical protein [Verrucomicrobiota bacterium]
MGYNQYFIMEIMSILSDATRPRSSLVKVGMECTAGAMIGGTVAKAWNSTLTGTVSGAIMPIFWNLRHGPYEHLVTALSFTAIVNMIDYFAPVHRLVSCSIAIGVSSYLGMRAARDIFPIALISASFPYLLNGSSYAVAAIWEAMKSNMTSVSYLLAVTPGTVSSFLVGGVSGITIGLLGSTGRRFRYEHLLTPNTLSKWLLGNLSVAAVSMAAICALRGVEGFNPHFRAFEITALTGMVAGMTSIYWSSIQKIPTIFRR